MDTLYFVFIDLEELLTIFQGKQFDKKLQRRVCWNPEVRVVMKMYKLKHQ